MNGILRQQGIFFLVLMTLVILPCPCLGCGCTASVESPDEEVMPILRTAKSTGFPSTCCACGAILCFKDIFEIPRPERSLALEIDLIGTDRLADGICFEPKPSSPLCVFNSPTLKSLSLRI